jgi:hypothetical protein
MVCIVISAVCSGLPYLYARKVASENSADNSKPIWFGGIANLYLVTSVLGERSKQGDKWAGRARLAYCVGVATVPALIAGLAVHDFWLR